MLGSSVEGVGIFLSLKTPQGVICSQTYRINLSRALAWSFRETSRQPRAATTRVGQSAIQSSPRPGLCSACGTNFSKSPLARLEPLGQQAGALMLQHIRVKKGYSSRRTASWQLLVWALDWPEARLPEHLIVGMPSVGKIPASVIVAPPGIQVPEVRTTALGRLEYAARRAPLPCDCSSDTATLVKSAGQIPRGGLFLWSR